MTKLKNKRAQQLLTEETLKIVIAVICIGFLAILVFFIWNAQKNSGEFGQAKASSEHLILEMSKCKPEMKETKQVEIFSPNKWSIMSFPTTISQAKFPELCLTGGLKKCICFCKITGCLIQKSSEISCIGSEFSVLGDVQTGSIEIANPPIILKINCDTKTITKP